MAENNQNVQTELNKGLSFISVYAIATGAIFTFIGYWDTIFISYCGPATGLAFLLMMLAVLPIAFVYCELAPHFPQAGAELVYNTVGFNKHVGFFSAWAIMGAWIAVPPAAVMAIVEWFTSKIFRIEVSIGTITIIGVILLVLYFCFSLLNIEIAGHVQTFMLVLAILGCLTATIAIFASGHWSPANYHPFFQSSLGDGKFGGWCIGLALIITPFFGFETVPQMIEEANFPIEYATKAIWGSVVTCGVVYSLLFFALGGLDTYQNLLYVGGDPANGEVSYLTITAMEGLGWQGLAYFFGVCEILCAIGTCLLGFWVSTVRLFYAMGHAGYLPKSFCKVNKNKQPIVPNVLLLAISVIFLVLQNSTTFMKDFFNLMSFCCAVTYATTSLSAMRIKKKYPHWKSAYKLPGGQATRVAAVIIAVIIAIGCTIGQGIGSWISLGVYIGIGVILWITMLGKWKTEKVKWITPDGEMEF